MVTPWREVSSRVHEHGARRTVGRRRSVRPCRRLSTKPPWQAQTPLNLVLRGTRGELKLSEEQIKLAIAALPYCHRRLAAIGVNATFQEHAGP